jgi:Holliday junction resolvasome RuvABC endonuclease subunit
MILTLDPSIAAFGWAVVNEKDNTIVQCGCFMPDKKQTVSRSKMKNKLIDGYNQDTLIIGTIAKQLASIISDRKITVIYTEAPIGSQSFRAADALSMCKATVMTVAALNNCIIVPVSPLAVKKGVIGDNHATKEELLEKLPNYYSNIASFFLNTLPKVKKHAISDALAVYASTLKTNHE